MFPLIVPHPVYRYRIGMQLWIPFIPISPPSSTPSSFAFVPFTMTPEQRAWLKEQIKVKMKREQNVSLKELKAWLKEDTSVDWSQVNSKTFHSFAQRNREKFRNQGNLKRKPGSGGNGEISLRKVHQIRELAINKRFRGTKTVADHLGIGATTVRKYLKKAGCKPYHRYRCQNLKPEHKEARVR